MDLAAPAMHVARAAGAERAAMVAQAASLERAATMAQVVSVERAATMAQAASVELHVEKGAELVQRGGDVPVVDAHHPGARGGPHVGGEVVDEDALVRL